MLINDARAAERVVDAARRIAPAVPVLMRARFVRDVALLSRLGARDVVVEELEGGLEVLSRLLGWLGVPADLADESLRASRDLPLPR